MPDTSGPQSASSSPSADLQRSLESRLRVRLGGRGSPLYALTWKHWAMPSGPPICALRARAHPMSDSSSTGAQGWPTPTAANAKQGATKASKATGQDLPTAVGWGTPMARDWKDGGPCETVPVRGHLGRQVWDPTGWATPTVADSRNTRNATAARSPGSKGNPGWTLCDMVWTLGTLPDTCCVPTDDRGRLHPSHVGWIMGYPIEWDSCGATAMQLCRS